MDKRGVNIVIDSLPKMPNQLYRRHWSAMTKEKTKWVKLLSQKPMLFIATDLYRPLKKAKLTLTRCSSSEPDFDGLVGSFKWVIDALVKNGILTDDTTSVIGQPEYKWEKTKRGEGYVRIFIEWEV